MSQPKVIPASVAGAHGTHSAQTPPSKFQRGHSNVCRESAAKEPSVAASNDRGAGASEQAGQEGFVTPARTPPPSTEISRETAGASPSGSHGVASEANGTKPEVQEAPAQETVIDITVDGAMERQVRVPTGALFFKMSPCVCRVVKPLLILIAGVIHGLSPRLSVCVELLRPESCYPHPISVLNPPPPPCRRLPASRPAYFSDTANEWDVAQRRRNESCKNDGQQRKGESRRGGCGQVAFVVAGSSIAATIGPAPQAGKVQGSANRCGGERRFGGRCGPAVRVARGGGRRGCLESCRSSSV